MKKRISIVIFFAVFLTVTMILTAGCITLGHQESPMDLWVLKTDSNGSMEWMTIIADDPNNRGEKIIQTSDGGYAIAGTGTDVRQNGPVPFIFRLDKNGHILPTISMGKSPDYGSSIAMAPDNGYVVASYSGILFRVNENGTVL